MPTENKAADKAAAGAQPLLDTEVANRLRDPYETAYMGVLRTDDPLLLERGGGSSSATNLYRDLKRDGKVFAGLQKRRLALISRPWQVEPVEESEAGSADAAVVMDMLKRCSFDQVCGELMDALLVGHVVMEIVWTVRDGRVVPARILKRAQRRFVYRQRDEQQPPELHLLTRANMLTGERLPERKFIVHRVNPEDDNPYGTGLGLQLYWPVFFKRQGIISWNQLSERFGTPTAWGRYPKGSGPKEKGTLFDALRAISKDGVIMTPEGMAVELLESKLTGSVTTQQSLAQYMDDWISEVLLGQEPRASGGGGALAAASKERQSVRLDLVQADSDLLSDTLNSTLIRWICEFNGLAPCAVHRTIKEEEDLMATSETDKNVAAMGFKPTLDSVKAKYGEGWEVAAPAPPPSNEGVQGQGGGEVLPLRRRGATSFAEADEADPAQRAIDDAVQSVNEGKLSAAMSGLIEPLLQAIEGASNFQEALAAAEAAYPQVDTTKLQAMLAQAMFGAEAFGRESDA